MSNNNRPPPRSQRVCRVPTDKLSSTTTQRGSYDETNGGSGIAKLIFSFVTLLFFVLVGIWAFGGIAGAQKDSVPKPQDKLALGNDEVEQLLLLIDTNKTGKITKQAWMRFMEEEFDRLDKNKSGEVDAKELARSRLRARPFPAAGK